MLDRIDPIPFRTWGLWAVLTGALALGLVFYQLAPPATGPQPSVGTQIGEIAGDMRRAAWRSFLGLETAEPEPVAPSWSDRIQPFLFLAAPILGILAVLLSLVSGIRGEDRRFLRYGLGLGSAAILFHFLWWLVLLVLGVMLLIAIIQNVGGIFGGGLFGG